MCDSTAGASTTVAAPPLRQTSSSNDTLTRHGSFCPTVDSSCAPSRRVEVELRCPPCDRVRRQRIWHGHRDARLVTSRREPVFRRFPCLYSPSRCSGEAERWAIRSCASRPRHRTSVHRRVQTSDGAGPGFVADESELGVGGGRSSRKDRLSRTALIQQRSPFVHTGAFIDMLKEAQAVFDVGGSNQFLSSGRCSLSCICSHCRSPCSTYVLGRGLYLATALRSTVSPAPRALRGTVSPADANGKSLRSCKPLRLASNA